MEIRAINEKSQSRITSLQAAETIALELDDETLSFVDICIAHANLLQSPVPFLET